MNIVLTGRVATGKSTLAKILKYAYYHEYKVVNIDYDEIFKICQKELFQNPSFINIYQKSKLYSDNKLLSEFERIMHPKVYLKVFQNIQKTLNEPSDKPLMFIHQIPVFFQTYTQFCKYFQTPDLIINCTLSDLRILAELQNRGLNIKQAKFILMRQNNECLEYSKLDLSHNMGKII